MKKIFSRRRLMLGLAALGCLAGPAWGSEVYPNRPIRVVVPFAPGGATDAARWVKPVKDSNFKAVP